MCKGKADSTGSWKCAKEDTNCGRMEAEFQLEKASYISHIDIGVYYKSSFPLIVCINLILYCIMYSLSLQLLCKESFVACA